MKNLNNIAIIGCGKIAKRHLMAYRKFKNVKIILVDENEKAAQSLARGYHIKWSSDPYKIIQRKNIDIIDVCTPTPTHAQLIIQALLNKKHVFCEKPLTDNLKDAKKILKIAESSKKILMVGYLYRFHPAFQLTKKIIDKKIIGKPYYGIFRVGGRGSHRIWKHQKNTSGGVINEMLVHMLDLILWYFKDISQVETLIKETILKERLIDNKRIKATAEDLVVLDLKTKEKAHITCQSDLITPSYMNSVEIQGDNGSIWTSVLDYFPTTLYCKKDKGRYNKGKHFFEFSYCNYFEKELGDFLSKINENKKPDYQSIKDSIKIIKIINKIK